MLEKLKEYIKIAARALVRVTPPANESWRLLWQTKDFVKFLLLCTVVSWILTLLLVPPVIGDVLGVWKAPSWLPFLLVLYWGFYQYIELVERVVSISLSLSDESFTVWKGLQTARMLFPPRGSFKFWWKPFIPLTPLSEGDLALALMVTDQATAEEVEYRSARLIASLRERLIFSVFFHQLIGMVLMGVLVVLALSGVILAFVLGVDIGIGILGGLAILFWGILLLRALDIALPGIYLGALHHYAKTKEVPRGFSEETIRKAFKLEE